MAPACAPASAARCSSLRYAPIWLRSTANATNPSITVMASATKTSVAPASFRSDAWVLRDSASHERQQRERSHAPSFLSRTIYKSASCAGPRITTNSAGRMSPASGMVILSAAVAARFSARCRRFRRSVSEYTRSTLRHARAESIGLNEILHEHAQLIHARARIKRAQRLLARHTSVHPAIHQHQLVRQIRREPCACPSRRSTLQRRNQVPPRRKARADPWHPVSSAGCRLPPRLDGTREPDTSGQRAQDHRDRDDQQPLQNLFRGASAIATRITAREDHESPRGVERHGSDLVYPHGRAARASLTEPTRLATWPSIRCAPAGFHRGG